MNRRTMLWTSAAIALLSIAAATAAEPTGARGTDAGGRAKPIPPFSEVRQAVLRYFQARPDYRSGDLITREDVGPLFQQIERLGLPLPDAKPILEKLLAKNSFVAQQFGAENGRKFMRKIAEYPLAYDRVDRLSQLDRGRKIVRDLIQGPGGDKMIEYLTTAQGGIELGKMLSNDPHGADFNSPTGHIYTADMLLKRLEQSHAAALKAAKAMPVPQK